jgi:hypothetical protein
MSRRSLLLVALLCLGCREAAEVVVEETPPAVSTDFARLPELLAGMQKKSKVLVYEGLPSQFWEPQLREQELNRKESLDVHGYPVYEEPITPSASDADQLTTLFSARESFLSFDNLNNKKCGGFTAEYCVEWTTGETVTQLLLCLECAEIMLFGPGSELHCNVSPAAAQQLKQLLGPYRKNALSEKSNP